jgi:hypothetical protein
VTSNLQKGGGKIRIASSSMICRVSHLFLVCFIFIIVSGCHYASGVSTTLKDDGKVVFKRLAVLPFQQVSPEDEAFKTVRCPVCGVVFSTEKFPQGSEKVVEDIFFEQLKERKHLTLIPSDRVGGMYERVADSFLKADPIKTLKQVGMELEADGIIVGYVYRYRERKGYPYSAEKPASVAFEIHLIRVSDGAIVWRGIFDKTQTSLMEDILQISSFLKEGGKWVTVKELTAEGMEEVLKKFPGLPRDQGIKDSREELRHLNP